MSPLVLVILIGLTTTLGHHEGVNQVHFEKVGRIVLRPAFGHVWLEADLRPLFEVYDLIRDRVEAILGQRPQSFDQTLRRMDLARLGEQLTTVWSWLQTDLKAMVPVNEENDFLDVLSEVMDKVEEAGAPRGDVVPASVTPSTTTPKVKTTTTARSTSSTTTTVPRRTGRATLRRPPTSGHGLLEEEPEIRLAEGELRILGESLKLRELVELDDQRFKSTDPTQFENAMVGMERDLVQLVDYLQRELGEFTRSLSQLARSIFPPDLISAKAIQQVMIQLDREIAERGGYPVIRGLEDWASVPQPECHYKEGRLELHLVLPFSRDEPANLYQHKPSPWVHEEFFLRTRPKKAFLAWDLESRLAAELTPEELEACDKWDQMFWCQETLPMARDPSSLCLFNLFHQRPTEIESSCDLEVTSRREEITRIGPNQFQLHVDQPSTIAVGCLGRTEPLVLPVTDLANLKLNTSCPWAHSQKYVFSYQPTLEEEGTMLSRPFTSAMTSWLENLVPMPERLIARKVIRDFETNQFRSVPLGQLKQTVKAYIWNEVKEAGVYILLVSTPLSLLLFLGAAVRWCLRLRKRGRHGPRGEVVRWRGEYLRPTAREIVELENLSA